MRNAFTPPLNVPHSLSVSTETPDNLLILRHCKITKQITVFQSIYNPRHVHSYSKKKDGYRGKILDQSKAETQQGKHVWYLGFNGHRWLHPSSFAASTTVSLRVALLDRCCTVLASFTIAGSPLQLELPVYTSQQWPPQCLALSGLSGRDTPPTCCLCSAAL